MGVAKEGGHWSDLLSGFEQSSKPAEQGRRRTLISGPTPRPHGADPGHPVHPRRQRADLSERRQDHPRARRCNRRVLRTTCWSRPRYLVRGVFSRRSLHCSGASSSRSSDAHVAQHTNEGAEKLARFINAAQLKQHFYRPNIVTRARVFDSATRAVNEARDIGFALSELLQRKPLEFPVCLQCSAAEGCG